MIDGYRIDGYRIVGYQIDGYRIDGYRIDGYRIVGYRKDGYRIDGYRIDEYKIDGYRKKIRDVKNEGMKIVFVINQLQEGKLTVLLHVSRYNYNYTVPVSVPWFYS